MDMGGGTMVMRMEMRIAVAVVVPRAKAVVDMIDVAHRLHMPLRL